MNDEPDYNLLYETAENQAGYFTATQARTHGFSWERLSDNVKRGRFLRIVRGIMLKGAGLAELLPELGALLAFMAVVSVVAMARYRQTLD